MAARKKKTGDNMPLDRIGGFLFEGAIVAFGGADLQAAMEPEVVPGLVLGYIKKLGKSFADVVYPTPGGDGIKTNNITIRLRKPAEQLILIEPDQLNSRVTEYESLKLAAAHARTY